MINIIVSIAVSLITFLITTVLHEHIREYKEIKAKTAYVLLYYADIYTNPIEYDQENIKYNEASSTIRQLAAEWYSYLESKPKILIGCIENDKIKEVGKNLFGLSNSLSIPHNSKNNKETDKYREINCKIVDEIRQTLNIYRFQRII